MFWRNIGKTRPVAKLTRMLEAISRRTTWRMRDELGHAFRRLQRHQRLSKQSQTIAINNCNNNKLEAFDMH